MFSITKPGRDVILKFISEQSDQQFSYPEVGFSREAAPNRYNADHHRAKLGQGFEIFERGKAAIRAWKMFDMPWLELCWPDAPIEAGTGVAVAVSHLGFWSLNACRIVYVIEEPGKLERYGFAYGTLPQHGEIGEERFTVEYDRENENVWYDVYALSRPGPFARLAYPYTRSLEKFCRRGLQANSIHEDGF
jgi:uncharacterized protein (UPF0548 family)